MLTTTATNVDITETECTNKYKKYQIRHSVPSVSQISCLCLLVILHQLVEAQKDAQPVRTVVRLQVEADLVHDSRPSTGVVVLDHVVNASCELHSLKVRKKRLEQKVIRLPLPCTCGCVLPDALWGLDDGLHYVVSNELPVLFRDVTGRRFSVCTISFTPVLCHHVLQVDHT